MKKIAILLTCHNRIGKTIECLKSLFNCHIPENHSFDVFLVDDGSTDGTSEVVKNEFPLVHIIQGNGNLFWNRGMLLAWKTATQTNDFDFFLWLNDDTVLFDIALDTLLQKAWSTEGKKILVGATCSSNFESITYSGFQFYDRKLIPNGSWQACDYFNGNIVLIPALIFKKVGYLDSHFNHTLGDFDYGMRATKMGFLTLLSPKALGFCDSNTKIPIWRNRNYTVMKRIHHLYSPLGNNPNEFFIIDKRQYGLLNAIFHYFTLHLRTIFPNLWE